MSGPRLWRGIQPGFSGILSLVRIPIVAGRQFHSRMSRAQALLSDLVETTAHRWWHEQDPIGKVVRWEKGKRSGSDRRAKDAKAASLWPETIEVRLLAGGPQETVCV